MKTLENHRSMQVGLAGGLVAAILGANFVNSKSKPETETSPAVVFVEPRLHSAEPLRTYTPMPLPTRVPSAVIRSSSYQNPLYIGDDDFARDSETMRLARALLGEGSGEYQNKQHLDLIAKTMVNRARLQNSSVSEALLSKRGKRLASGKVIDVYAYSCFDPNEGLLPKLKDPLRYEPKASWEACYATAERALKGGLNVPAGCENVTNYFVGGDPFTYRTKKEADTQGIPSWAYEMKQGVFVLDAEGKRIPRSPTTVVPVTNSTKKAYFYSFSHF